MSDYSKDDIYNLLKKSPQEFNDWKASQGDVDLSEMDFFALDTRSVDFSDADLNGSSFADCHLTEINFKNTDLTAVEFTRATNLGKRFFQKRFWLAQTIVMQQSIIAILPTQTLLAELS